MQDEGQLCGFPVIGESVSKALFTSEDIGLRLSLRSRQTTLGRNVSTRSIDSDAEETAKFWCGRSDLWELQALEANRGVNSPPAGASAADGKDGPKGRWSGSKDWANGTGDELSWVHRPSVPADGPMDTEVTIVRVIDELVQVDGIGQVFGKVVLSDESEFVNPRRPLTSCSADEAVDDLMSTVDEFISIALEELNRALQQYLESEPADGAVELGTHELLPRAIMYLENLGRFCP